MCWDSGRSAAGLGWVVMTPTQMISSQAYTEHVSSSLVAEGLALWKANDQVPWYGALVAWELKPCNQAILKGPNYITWAKFTKTSLGSRGLWGHITASEALRQVTQGADGKEIVAVDEGKWEQKNLMVLSILQSSLDTPIKESYSQCETTKKLWDTLQKMNGKTSNFTRIFEIKREINNLHQEEMDFTNHLGKYSQLWSELEMLRPSTTDPSALEERREQDKIFGLLLTLNSSFNDVLKHIMRAKELPSCDDDVCAQLQKELGSEGLFGAQLQKELVSEGHISSLLHRISE